MLLMVIQLPVATRISASAGKMRLEHHLRWAKQGSVRHATSDVFYSAHLSIYYFLRFDVFAPLYCFLGVGHEQ